jgi:hypothetical protein
MNEEKAKILLRLFKEDLITTDEFLILCKEEPIYISTTPSWIPTQPFLPYYTSGTGAGDVTITTSGSNSAKNVTSNVSMNSQSTVGGAFSKKWINPEEPSFDS